MSDKTQFSKLEITILKSKGMSDTGIAQLHEAGITCKADFATIGDFQTLADITGIPLEIAQKIMDWALGRNMTPATTDTPTIMVENPDAVYCAYCQKKQPKDYKSGDLCFSCGKQVEPIATCYWCAASGPGKFCRNCGATFVPVGELELALHLKSEGIAKDEIAPRLLKMSAAEKGILWEKVRRPLR